MRVSRLWLALVLLIFCLPLFIGLGNSDVRGDEAGHSFSVVRILETGDWLVPKSSPNEDWAFVEKPPLKFWIVAAPIRLGLLPLNEFSLRFWDALFGGAAFLYIFAIGSLMAGPVCGAVAVLVCFTFSPLLFEHGLRSNNMEATVLLLYCGGVFHYFKWARAEGRRRAAHALAVALFFAVGFMTKFVAILFLPAVLVAGSLIVRGGRQKLLRDWKLWTGMAALAVALAAPWFVFATVKFGQAFWNEILFQQVVTRFESYLDPNHLQPWWFYWVSLYKEFLYSGSVYLVAGGILLLLFQTVWRRWTEGAVVLVWLALPVALISLGRSKLIHYVYPFVPPFGLATGYLVALALMLLPAPIDRALWTPSQYAAGLMPRTIARLRTPRARRVLRAVAVAAVGIATVSLAYGQVRLEAAGHVLFKSSGVLRPALVAVVCAVLAGENRRATQAVVPLLLAGLLPLPAYRETLGRLTRGDAPMRSARDCLQRVAVEINPPPSARGLYVVGFNTPGIYGHEHYYYFRTIRPWERTEAVSFPSIYDHLYRAAEQKPILLRDSIYREFLHRSDSVDAPTEPGSPPPRLMTFGEVVLLLPGPYEACSAETAGLAAPR